MKFDSRSYDNIHFLCFSISADSPDPKRLAAINDRKFYQFDFDFLIKTTYYHSNWSTISCNEATDINTTIIIFIIIIIISSNNNNIKSVKEFSVFTWNSKKKKKNARYDGSRV